MTIISAKYYKDTETNEDVGINVLYPDKQVSFLIDPANPHYAEIMELVEAGELTIEPADEVAP